LEFANKITQIDWILLPRSETFEFSIKVIAFCSAAQRKIFICQQKQVKVIVFCCRAAKTFAICQQKRLN
jgi:hypothetical protein